jgi:hypothetical protein
MPSQISAKIYRTIYFCFLNLNSKYENNKTKIQPIALPIKPNAIVDKPS